MRNDTPCPSHESLASFLTGKLPEEEEDEINRHLEACPACEQRAQELERHTDPLIEALRQPAAALHREPEATGEGLEKTEPGLVAADSSYLSSPQPFRLEGYQILRELGRGGMGVVYEAYQRRLQRTVAIKMILAGTLAGPEERVRFKMEGELLARLSHPNFVQVYEVGTVEVSASTVQPYLVLEHVDGGSLKGRLAKSPLSAREAAGQVLTLARAVEAAHAQGIVHRDLKPANVLVARDGTLKITDFGLAKELGANTSLTPTGLTVGTPNYMAPEQTAGRSAAIGPATDVYALGAILYEMLTERPPFEGDTPMEVLLQVLQRPPVPVSRLRPGVPRDLETICLKCLEKEPHRRYTQAAELARDLQAWLEDRPIAARPVGRLERAHKWARRHPLPAALVAFLVLSLLIGSATSTYFGVTATNRANETQQALAKEEEARQASDRRAAELQLAQAQALAEAGEVDRGLFLTLRALERTPEKDRDLQRIIQRGLEAWLPFLPRLRWYRESPPGGDLLFLDKEVLRWQDNRLFVFEAAGGRPLGAARTFPGKSIAACGPNGRRVCTRSDDKGTSVLRVFDRATGQQLGLDIRDERATELRATYPGHRYVIHFSPDESLLAREFGYPNGSERQLWDVATGRQVGAALVRGSGEPTAHLLQTAGGQPYWLFWREGDRVAVTAVEAVDARTGKSLGDGPGCLPAEVERPSRLFPRRNVLQSVFYQAEARVFGVWDLSRATLVREPWRLPRTNAEQQVTEDGRNLVHISADQRVAWHDLGMEQPLTPTAAVDKSAFAGPGFVRVSPLERSCVFAPSSRGLLKRIDFPRLSAPRTNGAAAGERTLGGAGTRPIFSGGLFSPDRRLLIVGNTARNYRRPYARLVSTADSSPVGLPLTDCDCRVAFSPSGRLVALATWDGPPGTPLIVRVYDARTGEPRSREFGMDYYIHALEFSPDGRRLVVGQLDGAVLCDLEKGAQVTLAQPGPVDRVHFSRDGSRIALCGRSGWSISKPGVRVWDIATAKPAGALVPMSDAPLVLATEQGDGFLTIEDHGDIRRWDFAAAAPTQNLGRLADWPGISLRNAASIIDPDRRRLALGTTDGSLYCWDLRTLRRLGPAGELHQPVAFLAYSCDDRWLAVAGDEGAVALFDPGSGRRAGPLLTHGIGLLAMTFTPDGNELLTATRDGRCHRWELGKMQPLTVPQWQTWLEAATGMRLDGDALTALTVAEYDRRVQGARNLPVPLTAPAADPVRWHAAEALRAEDAGHFNSARWHLDRWLALEPKSWLPLARRARLHALEDNAKEAAADMQRASNLSHGSELENWKRHQAIVGKMVGRPLAVIEAK